MASSINASLSAGVVTTADTSGVLNIQTAGTTAVTVNASQVVSIGTTNVGGTLNTTTTSGNWGEIIYDLANNASMLAFRNNAGSAAGNISLSSAGATSLLISSVAGVNFPATQVASADANTLDDYEEGTWTPTFGGSGSDPTGVSYNTQEGTYTKIGNRVFVEFFLSFTTFTGGSNAVAIKGLPFTGSGNGDGAMKIENVSFSAGKTYLVGTISASAISPQQVGGSPTAWIGLTIATNVTSSGTTKFFTGSLCYKI